MVEEMVEGEEEEVLLQDSFDAFDDTILTTNPKCGTTWLKALAFTIANHSRYDFSNHPLLTNNPHEIVPVRYLPTLEVPMGKELSYVETLPSPRLLATHMPLLLLPKSLVANHSCRIVYICQEPKDAFVSRWHFGNKIFRGGHEIDLEAALNMFCEGASPYGPFWDHCLEYWRESIARPDRVLFLKYEEMMSEPVKHGVRLAVFLGVPFTGKEEDDRIPEEVVKLCSFEKLSRLQANQKGYFMRRRNLVVDMSDYFRRGKIGDWVNYTSEEMGRKLDYIVKEKLRDRTLCAPITAAISNTIDATFLFA
ncbi:cytosolic sulfotransferase 16-like [Phragmites australis]|uniref:cytosolic sulfotransferase 16-like n=1 Tax=Phragmites australis TaxID=29695 RepID=UPI002D76C927|nr:cytosolic sulfotransferase 16-like [Phragmites australis]